MNGDAPSQTRWEWQQADNHIREVLAIELKHRDKALRKQGLEYERRLKALNNENERILAAAATSVSNDKFEGYIRNIEEWSKKIDEFKTATETAAVTLALAQSKLRLVVLAWIATATFAIGLVEVLLRLPT